MHSLVPTGGPQAHDRTVERRQRATRRVKSVGVDFSRVVRRRRMVRHFTPEPVPLETVEQIVRTAQHAPSAGYTQGVSFVLVTEPAMRRRIAEIAGEPWYTEVGHHPFISEAPVHVVLCTSEEAYRVRYREPDKRKPGQPEKEWPVPYWHTDAGCALMLLLLAAVDEGLDGAFVSARDPGDLRNLLGIPDYVQPVGVVLIGHGARDMPSASLRRGRRSLDQVLHRERW
jgi:nitroreductase